MKLRLEALEVMAHFIFPVSSFISLLAGFHSLNRMPLVSEMVHPRGFSFAVQRNCVLLRDAQQLTWSVFFSGMSNG